MRLARQPRERGAVANEDRASAATASARVTALRRHSAPKQSREQQQEREAAKK